jgi:hypothetical protein
MSRLVKCHSLSDSPVLCTVTDQAGSNGSARFESRLEHRLCLLSRFVVFLFLQADAMTTPTSFLIHYSLSSNHSTLCNLIASLKNYKRKHGTPLYPCLRPFLLFSCSVVSEQRRIGIVTKHSQKSNERSVNGSESLKSWLKFGT